MSLFRELISATSSSKLFGDASDSDVDEDYVEDDIYPVPEEGIEQSGDLDDIALALLSLRGGEF